MKIINYPARKDWSMQLQRPAFNTFALEKKVNAIISDVKKNGDQAIKKYALRFDKAELTNLLVSTAEIKTAEKKCDPELKKAIHVAKKNIERFHTLQKQEFKVVKTMPGVTCWTRPVAIEKVGLYIPGGSAPLFSTVLMLGIPAIIAGCKEIILCSPANKDGNIEPAILYTAKLIGINKIFKIGGAQAIAAMAYGTKSVPQVYKIFGPGNQYVTCAKQIVNKNGTAIDLPAGPSELAILADETSEPAFVAADLLSQAEHGADSQVILVSDNKKIISKTLIELKIQLEKLSRKKIAKKALQNSKAILVKNKNEAINLLNDYAPEHMIIACSNSHALSKKIINAGSVFIGNYSCESAGDYASGTNHTLPTNGFAKAYSGVSVDSFLKKITYQKITKEGIKNIGPAIEIMAEAERLQAHKNAISIRLKSIKNENRYK